MHLNEYQQRAHKTAFYGKSIDPLAYCALKLNGEAGEVAEKVGKLYRDEKGRMSVDRAMAIAAELGDVLWYLQELAGLLDIDLEEVAMANLEKLEDRATRGVICGDGDNR